MKLSNVHKKYSITQFNGVTIYLNEPTIRYKFKVKKNDRLRDTYFYIDLGIEDVINLQQDELISLINSSTFTSYYGEILQL